MPWEGMVRQNRTITIVDEENDWAAALASQTINTQMEQVGQPIVAAYKDVIDPIRVQGSIGVSDDPTDESIHFFLAYVPRGTVISTIDRNRLINSGSVIWYKGSKWRSVGTDAGPVLVSQEVDEWLTTSSDQAQDLEPPYDIELLLLCYSNTSSDINGALNVTYNVIMKQREKKDRPSDWTGYTWEETEGMA